MRHTIAPSLLTLALAPAVLALSQFEVDEGIVCDGQQVFLAGTPLYNETQGFTAYSDIGDELQYSDDIGLAYAQAMANESMAYDFDCGEPECYDMGLLPESTEVSYEDPNSSEVIGGGSGVVVTDPSNPSPENPSSPSFPSSPATPDHGTPGSVTWSSAIPSPPCPTDKDADKYANETVHADSHTRSIAKRTSILPHRDFSGTFISVNPHEMRKRNRVGNFAKPPAGIIPRWKRGTTLKFSVRTCNCGTKLKGQTLIMAMNGAAGQWGNANMLTKNVNGRGTWENLNLVSFQVMPEKSDQAIDFLVRCEAQDETLANGEKLRARAFFPNDRSRMTIDVFPFAFQLSLEKLTTVMAHELGHVLGLAHETINLETSVAITKSNPNSVMGRSATRSLNTNDVAAFRKLMSLPDGEIVQDHEVNVYASRRKFTAKEIEPVDLDMDVCKPDIDGKGKKCYVTTQRVCY